MFPQRYFRPRKIFAKHRRPSVSHGGGKMRSCRSGVAVCLAPTATRRDSARVQGRVGARTRGLLLLSALRIASDAWVRPCQGGRCTRLNSAQYRKPPLGGEVALPLQDWICTLLPPPHLLPPPPPPRTCYSALKMQSSRSSLLKKTFADETATAVRSAESTECAAARPRKHPCDVRRCRGVAAFCRGQADFTKEIMWKEAKGRRAGEGESTSTMFLGSAKKGGTLPPSLPTHTRRPPTSTPPFFAESVIMRHSMQIMLLITATQSIIHDSAKVITRFLPQGAETTTFLLRVFTFPRGLCFELWTVMCCKARWEGGGRKMKKKNR